MYHGGMLGLIKVKPHSRTTCKAQGSITWQYPQLAQVFPTATKSKLACCVSIHQSRHFPLSLWVGSLRAGYRLTGRPGTCQDEDSPGDVESHHNVPPYRANEPKHIQGHLLERKSLSASQAAARGWRSESTCQESSALTCLAHSSPGGMGRAANTR